MNDMSNFIKNKRAGIYVIADYVAKGKRKSSPLGIASESKQLCLNFLRKYRDDHSGKFISARQVDCVLYEIVHQNNSIKMKEVSLESAQTNLTEEELYFLNS